MKKRMAWMLGLVSVLALLLAGACQSGQPTDGADAQDATPDAAAAQLTEDQGGAQDMASAMETDQHAEDEAHGHEEEAHDDEMAALDIVLTAVEGSPQWRFEPSTIEVPVGERVKLTLVNEGQIEHDIEVHGMSAEHIEMMSGAEHSDEMGAGHSEEMVAAHAAAGETASVMFTPTEPGEYEFSCTLPGHKEAGMTGTIVVTG